MVVGIQPQKKALHIALTDRERDDLLRTEWTCRIGTVGPRGTPHVSPVWFVWDGESIWISSLIHSRRWSDIAANRTVSVCVDTGRDYYELRGVEFVGQAEFVGEKPRRGDPNPEIEKIEEAEWQKYGCGGRGNYDGRHAWIRVRPARQFTWDFSKITRS